MHLFVRSFVCRFAHSIVRSFMVIHSIVCSFNFVCSFIDPFIYLVIMFLLFLTQVPPVGIILLLDLVLTVSRDFFFSFLYITYTSNKRFDSCSNWNRFFSHFQIACFIVVFSLIQQIKENEELKNELSMDSPVILLSNHKRLSSPEQYL